MPPTRALPVVIHYTDESIFRGRTGAFVLRHSLRRYLKLQWVTDTFPDLLSTASIIVLKAFKVKDEDRRERLDENLFSRGDARALGGVEVSGDSFGDGEVFKGICNGADF